MRKGFTVVVLLSFFLSGWSQGIEFFEGTWKEALELSSKEDKLIFVDAYTTWCGPCKRMAKMVFTQEEVGAVYNQKFINIKMDMEAEKNMEFISNYPVSAYPTLLFISGDGSVVHKEVGGKDVNAFLGLVDIVDKKFDRSLAYVEEYEAGRRDYEFVLKYIESLNKSSKSSVKVSNDFIRSRPELSEEQWTAFYYEAASEIDSRLFDEFIARKDLLLKSYSEEQVKTKVRSAADNTVLKAINYEMMSLVDEAIQKYKLFHPKKESRLYEMESKMHFYKGTGNVDKFLDQAQLVFKKGIKKNNKKLTTLLEGLAEYKSNPKAKDLMITIGSQMVKNEESWKTVMTYTNILMLHEKYDDALKNGNKALEMTEDPKEMRLTKGVLERVKRQLQS